MKAKQLSVFVENRSGMLAKILLALQMADIDIRALSLADTSDFGILRIITSNQDLASKTLAEQGFTIGSANVLAVELADTPGSLQKVLQLVSGAGINVEYMYAFNNRNPGKVIMIIRFDRMDEAGSLLAANEYKLFSTAMLEEI